MEFKIPAQIFFLFLHIMIGFKKWTCFFFPHHENGTAMQFVEAWTSARCLSIKINRDNYAESADSNRSAAHEHRGDRLEKLAAS